MEKINEELSPEEYEAYKKGKAWDNIAKQLVMDSILFYVSMLSLL